MKSKTLRLSIYSLVFSLLSLNIVALNAVNLPEYDVSDLIHANVNAFETLPQLAQKQLEDIFSTRLQTLQQFLQVNKDKTSEHFFASTHSFDDHVLYANQPSVNYAPENRDVAILLHGMGASPYYLSHIATELFLQGINTVNITLRDHGIDPLCSAQLNATHQEQWHEDIAAALALAQELLQDGGKIYAVGYSLGAALLQLTHFTASNSFAHSQHPGFDALIMFSPAVQLYNKKQQDFLYAACNSGVESLMQDNQFAIGTREKIYRFKYNQVGYPTVCSLIKTLHERDVAQAQLRDGALWDHDGQRLMTPVLTIYTENDTTISPQSIKTQAQFLGWHDWIHAFSKSSNTAHAKLSLSEKRVALDRDESHNHDGIGYLDDQQWTQVHAIITNFLESVR